MGADRQIATIPRLALRNPQFVVGMLALGLYERIKPLQFVHQRRLVMPDLLDRLGVHFRTAPLTGAGGLCPCA